MSKADPGGGETFVLDTHAWIWLSVGARNRFKPGLIQKLEKAAEESALRISAITPWEIAVLHRKNRLRLLEDPLDWVRGTIRLSRVQVVPLTPEIAVGSENLPGSFHGDPADRIIVASAIATRSALVTADRDILRYGEKGYVSTQPCG